MSFVVDYNCFTPLGENVAETVSQMEKGESGIKLCNYAKGGIESIFGAQVNIHENEKFSRLEMMMIAALEPVIKRNALLENALLIVSTTKGNIDSLQNNLNTEDAFLSSTAVKLAQYFGFETQPLVISNACVSGILAVSVGNRLINAEKYNQIFVVAADEMTEFVVSGFNSFQALSSEPCRPYDKDRSGVTLGEAAAAVLLSKTKGLFEIKGDGSINDANHISGPSRTGEGLFRSISSALKEAKLTSQQIGFISAHGTATLYNDEMEAIAFDRLEMNNVPLNSLKGYFGHTLGASGLLEAVISFETIRRGFLLPSLGFQTLGVSKEIDVIQEKRNKDVRFFLKTASGFGGCNTAVIFERID